MADDVRVWVHGEGGRLPMDVAATIGNLIDTAYPGTMLDMEDTRGAVLALRIPELARGRRRPGVRRIQKAVVPAPDPEAEGMTRGFTLDDQGHPTLSVMPPEDIAKSVAEGLRHALDEQGAPNYLEWTLLERDAAFANPDGSLPQYLVYACRSEGQSPHALRQQAEKERDVALSEAARLRSLVATMLDDGGSTVRCQLTNDKGTGRCPGSTAAVKWEDGFRDYICGEHALNAEERGAIVVRIPT